MLRGRRVVLRDRLILSIFVLPSVLSILLLHRREHLRTAFQWDVIRYYALTVDVCLLLLLPHVHT